MTYSDDEMPKCWERLEDWRMWLALRAATPGRQEGVVTICTDCLPEYRDSMVAAGRCQHPETLFIRAKDGDVTGVSRTQAKWRVLVFGGYRRQQEMARRARALLVGGDAEAMA